MNEVEKWTLRTLAAAVVVATIIFVGVSVYEDAQRRELPYTDIDTRIGTVVAINNCYAGKHSTYCDVTLDGNRTFETDITDYPGDNLQVGQELYTRVRRQGNLQTTYRITLGSREMVIMRRERIK